MNKNENYLKNETFTRTVAFRTIEAQYQECQELLERVPGSDVGNMYREIFARGLESLKAFYAKQGLLKSAGSDEEKGA
jgi:hypothetical protein